MPNTREKLIELLKLSDACLCDLCGEEGSIDRVAGVIADNLIANGVTVQEWISVKDRLPEDDSDVLAYLRIGEEGRIYPANYAKGMWFDCIFNTPATETTTHWMPLPQPPKGE
mgnify:CR=1 FL=1